MSEVKEDPVNCHFFGEKLGTRWIDNDTGIGVYRCKHPEHPETTIEQCWSCKDFIEQGTQLEKTDIKIERIYPKPKQPEPEKKTDLGIYVDRNRKPLNLLDHFRGAHLFLILSGPSSKSLDLNKLNRRGVLTMGVNNSPAVFRPNLWSYVDPSKKFHQGIWFDPYILKLVPEKRFKDKIRVKNEKGEFVFTKERVTSVPNMVGYRRNAFFNPETWLSEDSVNWGNSLKSSEANGHPRVLSVMLGALKQAYYLGIRRLYLIGCDFRMKLDNPQNYAFPQTRTLDAIGSNNAAYYNIANLLKMLKPKFDEAGYEIFNCYEDSGLKVFPYMSFDEAVAHATKRVPDTLDTEGWYD